MEEDQYKVKGWRLISQNGVAPIVTVYYFRGYRIVYSYYYGHRNQIHQFGHIILTTPRGKRYEFDNLEQLNQFLRERNLPPFWGGKYGKNENKREIFNLVGSGLFGQ